VAEYAISFARSARKQLQVLDRALALRIVGRVESLAVMPRPVGCVKLEGGVGLWRIRVGDYRVIYEMTITVASTYRPSGTGGTHIVSRVPGGRAGKRGWTENGRRQSDRDAQAIDERRGP